MMPARNPAVSVIVPCRNEARDIQSCLGSILAQEPPQGGFEVIVADGMSGDGTQEIIQRISGEEARVRLVDNPERIVSTGLNRAIRSARGEVIVRMDAHTEYAPDYLHRCLEVLEETGADNVGGPARTAPDSYMRKAVAAAYHSRFSVGGARFHDVDYEGPVDTVTYGCWRKETFAKFGYFDEELVRNQDDEFNLRIIRGGGKIWQSPKIKSWYRPRASLAALFKQYMQYGYWKVRVIQKHKLPASWRHLVPGSFVLTLMLLFLLSVFSFPISLFPSSPWSLVSGPVGSWSLFALCSLLLAYGAAVLAASVVTARKTEWKLLPLLPLVFPCYHLGYGYGFLRGVWDFLIRRLRPQANFSALTR